MSEEKSLNFLEEIVEEDLRTGKWKSIHTRFPPEPNGYLHIGHAKSICLNFGLAEKYGGKTNLRFDDTNPVTEDTEYVDSIQEDVKWLGFIGIMCSTLPIIFPGFTIPLLSLSKGLADVDDASAEEIAANKEHPLNRESQYGGTGPWKKT
jgi:glutaminyl-tRNA synthetase